MLKMDALSSMHLSRSPLKTIKRPLRDGTATPYSLFDFRVEVSSHSHRGKHPLEG